MRRWKRLRLIARHFVEFDGEGLRPRFATSLDAALIRDDGGCDVAEAASDGRSAVNIRQHGTAVGYPASAVRWEVDRCSSAGLFHAPSLIAPPMPIYWGCYVHFDLLYMMQSVSTKSGKWPSLFGTKALRANPWLS